MATIEQEAQYAAEVLRRGGIVLYPTDTIWGLGCDPQNASAIEKIYSLKGRPKGKSMLLLSASLQMASQYVSFIPEKAKELIAKSTQPLTIIYSGATNLAGNLLPPDNTIGIRITQEAFSKRMIENFGKPVVSTSANISGAPLPSDFASINPRLYQGVDYAVKVKRNQGFQANASSIVKVDSKGNILKIR